MTDFETNITARRLHGSYRTAYTLHDIFSNIICNSMHNLLGLELVQNLTGLSSFFLG